MVNVNVLSPLKSVEEIDTALKPFLAYCVPLKQVRTPLKSFIPAVSLRERERAFRVVNVKTL